MHSYIHSFQKCLLNVSWVTGLSLSIGDRAANTADESPPHTLLCSYFHGGWGVASQINKLPMRYLGCQLVVSAMGKNTVGRVERRKPNWGSLSLRR